MPTKKEAIEDLLGAIEERFYEVLTREEFEDYLGAKVTIIYTAKPRLQISIRESGRPGPRKGQKFKKRVGPSKRTMQRHEEIYGNSNDTGI